MLIDNANDDNHSCKAVPMSDQPRPVEREVFVSYSRKNKAFALTLVGALKARGRDAWIDLDAIPPSAEWWEAIKSGIDAAHTFVPVVTPDMIQSPVCMLEMDYA